MVKPTRIQVFFASGWPVRAWFVVVPTAICVLTLNAFEVTPAMLLAWPGAAWAALTAILSWVVGFLIAVVMGGPVLGSIYIVREHMNGGPFKIGDRVLVIGGPHRGRVGLVYSPWQGDTVRVDVGEEAKEAFKDIFMGAELLAVPSEDQAKN